MNAPARTPRISDPTEIRFGERIKLELPVTLAAEDGPTGTGLMRDISISGALIETALDLPVFTHLAVTLPAMGADTPACTLAACVIRQSLVGVAVEWRDMACPSLLGVLREAAPGRREPVNPAAG